MKADALIAQFERMHREHWAYAYGAAREGCVDCSGALVYAYKQLGGPAIAHGSNSIFRQSIGKSGGVALPGYAAFKVRPWTDADKANRWYGSEPGNVYHVGLVDGTGRHVLNAKSEAAGFSRDPIAGWTCFAPLMAVDYGEEGTDMETVLYQAEVRTKSTGLNLRSAPGGAKIGSLPRGATVAVLDDGDSEWWRVRYEGAVGYASAAYLARVKATQTGPQGEGADEVARDTRTTLMREDGVCIVLAGRWTVASD